MQEEERRATLGPWVLAQTLALLSSVAAGGACACKLLRTGSKVLCLSDHPMRAAELSWDDPGSRSSALQPCPATRCSCRSRKG